MSKFVSLFYGISTLVRYLMPNPVHTYIHMMNISHSLPKSLVVAFFRFHGISTFVGCLMPNREVPVV